MVRGSAGWKLVKSFDGFLDWAMFTAAVMTDNETRNTFVEQIHKYAGTTDNAPFMTVYDPTIGNASFGINRCVTQYLTLASVRITMVQSGTWSHFLSSRSSVRIFYSCEVSKSCYEHGLNSSNPNRL